MHRDHNEQQNMRYILYIVKDSKLGKCREKKGTKNNGGAFPRID